MLRDYIYLGSAPADEPCVQVITGEDYLPAMRLELKRFKELMQQIHPVPDELEHAAGYAIQREEHDFGPYLDLTAWFDSSNQAAIDWAYAAEEAIPTRWPSIPVQAKE